MSMLGHIGQDLLTQWVTDPAATVGYMIGQVP